MLADLLLALGCVSMPSQAAQNPPVRVGRLTLIDGTGVGRGADVTAWPPLTLSAKRAVIPRYGDYFGRSPNQALNGTPSNGSVKKVLLHFGIVYRSKQELQERAALPWPLRLGFRLSSNASAFSALRR